MPRSRPWTMSFTYSRGKTKAVSRDQMCYLWLATCAASNEQRRPCSELCSGHGVCVRALSSLTAPDLRAARIDFSPRNEQTSWSEFGPGEQRLARLTMHALACVASIPRTSSGTTQCDSGAGDKAQDLEDAKRRHLRAAIGPSLMKRNIETPRSPCPDPLFLSSLARVQGCPRFGPFFPHGTNRFS